MSMSHFCCATRKTPKNLDAVGVHSPCIRRAFDSIAHLPCIWLTFAHIGVQLPTKKKKKKKSSFSTITSFFFFFVIGNDFHRFVGKTSITSIFFNIQFVKRKVQKKKKKKSSPPCKRNSSPRFQVSGYGPA